MKIPDSTGRLVRNGKVQLQVGRKQNLYPPRDEQIRQGRIRKRIEDLKIESEIDQDLW